jgi:two-component system, LytTR family, response regulator
MLNVLIADDEPLARERLRFLLAEEKDLSIAGECRNGKEVVAALHARHFDVLFLDIQMPGGDGFEILEQLDAKQVPLTVFEKVAHQSAFHAQEQLKTALLALQPQNTYPARLVVPNGTRDAFVPVDEIEWIEAADYYACLHVGGRSLMLRETIKQLAETLDPRKFVRVHRSAIVNIAHVREILREGRNEGWVYLTNGQRLKMSKTGWHNLLAANRA